MNRACTFLAPGFNCAIATIFDVRLFWTLRHWQTYIVKNGPVYATSDGEPHQRSGGGYSTPRKCQWIGHVETVSSVFQLEPAPPAPQQC